MKLVRDNIPDIIRESGRTCRCYIVETKEQHFAFLKEKMQEEMQEFLDNPCLEEAADMLEVIKALVSIEGLDFTDVIEKAANKANDRGGFTAGVILTQVS